MWSVKIYVIIMEITLFIVRSTQFQNNIHNYGLFQCLPIQIFRTSSSHVLLLPILLSNGMSPENLKISEIAQMPSATLTPWNNCIPQIIRLLIIQNTCMIWSSEWRCMAFYVTFIEALQIHIPHAHYTHRNYIWTTEATIHGNGLKNNRNFLMFILCR